MQGCNAGVQCRGAMVPTVPSIGCLQKNCTVKSSPIMEELPNHGIFLLTIAFMSDQISLQI